MSEHAAKGMTEQEYRAAPGVNKSTLWEIRKSPAHYKWALENPSEDTPALKLGRAIHMAVLQPYEFAEHYRIAPDVDRRTKEGKAAWNSFLSYVEQDGCEVITQDDLNLINAIRGSVDREAGFMLKGAKTEVPLFWDDPRTGIRCKCRVDAMKELPDKFIVMDIKTTADAGLDAFTRAAVRYGYHVQAAHYIDGIKANGLNNGKPIVWWFVAVEKKPPYAVNLIMASPELIDEGEYRKIALMDKLDECMRTDSYPGYETCTMYVPGWLNELDEEEDG